MRSKINIDIHSEPLIIEVKLLKAFNDVYTY